MLASRGDEENDGKLTSSDAYFADLQLIANDEDLCNDRHQKDGNEALKLNKEVHLQKYEKPKHHDDPRGPLIHDIPDRKGKDHCESGAKDSANKSKDRLSRSHSHANGLR